MPIQSRVDDKVLLWMKEARLINNVPISTNMLIHKAKTIAKELKIEDNFYYNVLCSIKMMMIQRI